MAELIHSADGSGFKLMPDRVLSPVSVSGGGATIGEAKKR
jgi:hypothetical protein